MFPSEGRTLQKILRANHKRAEKKQTLDATHRGLWKVPRRSVIERLIAGVYSEEMDGINALKLAKP